VLQRHSDKLLEEIEGESSLEPEEEALRSEQCQQDRALDVRRQVWETSKLLKSALKHVEDIEDEDEPRILRGPMDTLQVHIRDGLKIASDIETKISPIRKHDNVESSKSTASTESKSEVSYPLPITIASNSRNSAGGLQQGASLAGSWNRSTVGLFSTSPAKSPFGAPARSPVPRFSSEAKSSTDSTTKHTGPLGSSADTPKSSNIPTPKDLSVRTSKPIMVTVNDDPLSMGVMTSISDTPSVKDSRMDRKHAETSAPVSVSKTSSLKVSSSSHSKSASTDNNSSAAQVTTTKENAAPKTAESHTSSPQRRRVPRGMFSSVSTSGLDPVNLNSSSMDATPTNHSMSRGFSEGSKPQSDNDNVYVAPSPLRGDSSEIRGLGAILSNSGGISSQSSSSSSQPHSPQSPLTSSFSSPSTPGLKSPSSPPSLQRSQPRPSPIQTLSVKSTPRSANGKSENQDCEDEEEISQLAKDLERAMNPTPTETVQTYFLQGEGLLQKIHSPVSMDDGLLSDEGEEGQRSEISDETQDLQDEVSNLSRTGSGSLRRQRSGGKRRFRISRSRSRNRSKSRQESRNKPALAPIQVGCPGTLASSEWPFDILSQNPPSNGQRGRPMPSSASATLVSSRSRHGQTSTFSTHTQQWQPRAGPRMPFAESVSVGNPTRVGKGIGSFTVYSIALTLCEPPKTTSQPKQSTGRTELNNTFSGNEEAHRLRSQTETYSNRSDTQQSSERSAGQTTEGDQINGALANKHIFLNASSKAAQMLNRSLSSPDLSSSAERLWISMHFPEELSQGHAAASITSGEINTSHPNMETIRVPQTETEAPIAKEQRITIHVHKRYTDFITLRSQLVEMLKYQARNSRRLLSRSLPSNTVRSTAPIQPTLQVSGGHSQSRVGGRHFDICDDDDDDDDEEERMPYGSYSGTGAGAGSSVSGSSESNISFKNIMRGMPKLPPKKVVGKFRPAFIEKRRRELEYFLEWVVAHPIIGDCPVVVQWFLEDQF
ncbi:hypothetical protein BGZ49_002286, partial [Haplosporangium sp. Z 27]